MDYEDYYCESFAPIKAIEMLTDIVYEKANNDWNVFSQMSREQGNELLSLNFAINLCAKYLLNIREKM